MIFTHVFACDKALGIGLDQSLLYHCKEDMKRFKAYTTGKTVVMGRKTYESIGKALPNRENIVLSKTIKDLPDAKVVGSIAELMDYLVPEEHPEVCIIGGGEIYAVTAPLVDKLVYTAFDYVEKNVNVWYPMGDIAAVSSISNKKIVKIKEEKGCYPVTIGGNIVTGLNVTFYEYDLKEI